MGDLRSSAYKSIDIEKNFDKQNSSKCVKDW